VQQKANKQGVWSALDQLAFSQKVAKHIGALKAFLGHYNLTRAAACPIEPSHPATTLLP
jgi:hypothetical protein